MSENMLKTLFEDDFFGLGFGIPTSIRYNTASTKDMNPVVWAKWTEKDEEGKDKFIGYKAVVRTVGVSEDDVKITVEKDGLIVEGKTEFEGYSYSQYVKLPVSREVVSNIEKISYHSKDGMTYVYLNIRTPKYKKIDIQKI